MDGWKEPNEKRKSKSCGAESQKEKGIFVLKVIVCKGKWISFPRGEIRPNQPKNPRVTGFATWKRRYILHQGFIVIPLKNKTLAP